MNGLLLCNQTMTANDLHRTCGISMDTINAQNCSRPELLFPYTPYLVGESSSLDEQTISLFRPPPIARELTDLSLSFGDENTVALAEMFHRLQEYNIGLIGASTSLYANRMSGFAGAVKDYQNALMAYRSSLGSSGAEKLLARQRAEAAFSYMQRHFHLELQSVSARVRARRGTPLTDLDRALNIARSSRNVTKLTVADRVQANKLVKFTQHAKFLGNGLAVIDFGSRIGNIRNSYTAGDNWERELFIESSSFAASAITATAVVKGGGAALGFLVVATPIGWIGLIVGGVVVVGVATASAVGMNSAVTEKSGGWYDSLMNQLGIK